MPTDRAAIEEGSIMDSLGVEIVGVMSPVSICMLLVVLLVSALAPPPSAVLAQPPVTAANLVYQESPSDSTAQKIEGSLLNAAVFVALVTAVTFLLVLLFYYNFTGCLRNYMRFSAFFVLASLGGSILISLLRRFAIPLDAPTALLLLFNTAVVGVVSVFSPAVPILLRQSYTVALGVIVAAWFTLLPEWTTWTLLLALAAYDLVAVLAPGGPLRLLVDLASSRDEDLPALLYEARPTITNPSPPPIPSSVSLELQPLHTNSDRSLLPTNPNSSGGHSHRPERSSSNNSSDPVHAVIEIENLEEETAPLVANEASSTQPGSTVHDPSSELEMFDTTRGIRLGLGDFVFYSVLVGRAAMYDLMTVYACYLAIISGLGCTLILLAVHRQALPALPISIILGVGFYFLTRSLMEPFVVGVSTSLVMF